MNILVACEESQRVCSEFRKFGHIAYSCDILPTSGVHPEWHIRQNVLHPLRHPDYFLTQDGSLRGVDHWDMILAFPPCTFLTVTGNSWYNESRYGDKALLRYHQREIAINFFMQFVYSSCPRIAIENPVGIMSSVYRKPDQIIHPYQFGHPVRKSTCLWLKGLPLLSPTNIVEPEVIRFKNGKTDDPWHYYTISLPRDKRSIERSKTFPGIARAMAEQWGCLSC